MLKPKVFIFSPADPTGETYRQMAADGCEVVLGDASWHTPMGNNEDDMCEMAKGADALSGTSIRSSPITARIMASAPELRIIAKTTIGVDDVDLTAATERGVLVTHCPAEANWCGVAEGTLAIILTLLKKARERDEAVKRGEWRDPALQGRYIGRRQDGYAGLTVGIIGLGRIGRRLAELLTPWRVRILACDPYVDLSRFVLSNAERVNLDTLLRESDIVSLHVILTEETRMMIGSRELGLMKPDAILVNTARGQVIDESAMIKALQNGKLAAAGLDVFQDEPLPADSLLRKLGHKVLLSPHMVTSNLNSGLKPGIEWATRSVFSALRGEVPDNVYNKEVIPKWLERFGGRKVL